ncbi:hypothetical protein AeNC1_002714 [Aphanomyces euteiches]|nr:hypothetical protein AeNC1_002714 [Aphanomyces euteiches]
MSLASHAGGKVATATPQQKQWVELQLLCRGNVGKTRVLQSLLAYYQKIAPHMQQLALPTVPDLTLSIPRSIDLVQLYEEVVEKGGYEFACEKQLWAGIAQTMKLKIQPAKLQALYALWLKGFEEHQVFGKKRNASVAFTEPIATHAEIQLTTSIRQTPLPVVTKRLKTHRQQLSDLGTMHRLVLALDSTLEDHIEWALNQLTVLSYGSTKENDCDLLLAHVPGLMDALMRQISLPTQSTLLANVPETASALQAQPDMRLERACRVLNIIRNLSMIADNEAAIASHEIFLNLAPQLLSTSHDEIIDLLWDIVCQVSKQMKQLQNEWLNFVMEALVDPKQKRSVVLRAAEVLCLWMKSFCGRIMQHGRFHAVLTRVIECCSRNRQDTLMVEDEEPTYPELDDEDDDDDHIGADEEDEVPSWPAPWEANYSSSATEIGASMGIVFASKGDGEPEFKKIDQEIRDRMLQVLFHLSEQNDWMRLTIAKHPDAIRRLANVITTCKGRAESARLASGVLANLSLAPVTFVYFLPIERELALVALSDASLAGMVTTIMANVFGINSI